MARVRIRVATEFLRQMLGFPPEVDIVATHEGRSVELEVDGPFDWAKGAAEPPLANVVVTKLEREFTFKRAEGDEDGETTLRS